jgi:ATP-dependent DNA helicase RecG
MDIARECDPSIRISVEAFDNIIIIDVPQSKNKPHRCTAGFYVRQGANAVKLTTAEIVGFIQSEGKVRFDEMSVEAGPYTEILDPAILRKFRLYSFVPEQVSDEQLLLNLGVVVHRNGIEQFNNAGILFFVNDPVRYLPQSAVVCVAYKGQSKVQILDKKIFEGSVFDNIEKALSFLGRHLNLGYDIKDSRRKEVSEIPDVVLREAVVNAIAHRDYFEKGAQVLIEIYANRIEITNPGGLVKGLTAKDLGKKTLSRNPLITSLLDRAGYVERLGSGIPRMKEGLANAGLPPPEFEFDNFFSVTLRRFDVQAEIKRLLPFRGVQGNRVSYIILSIQQNDFTVESAATVLQVTPRTVRNDLDTLSKLGWLTASGNTKARTYALTSISKNMLDKIS